MGKLRLSKATSLFLAWARKNRAPGTVAGYAHYLRRFVKHTKDKMVERVTPAVVETWSNKWHAIQAVQRLFGWLHKHARKIKVNPLEGMKRPASGKRRRVMDPSEMVALLRRASRSLRCLLIALRETIARPGEIRGATWDCIRTLNDRPFDVRSLVRGECFFHVIDGKAFDRRRETDEVRMIAITPRLGRMLARLMPPDGTAPGHIFQRADGQPWTGRMLREAMRLLRNRAGFVADWRGERIVAYTMRHTTATLAVAAGVRDSMLSAIMGHTTSRMTRRYIHLQPDMIQEGMKRIVEAKSKRKRKNDAPSSPRIDPDSPR